jgi:hypothetical protein
MLTGPPPKFHGTRDILGIGHRFLYHPRDRRGMRRVDDGRRSFGLSRIRQASRKVPAKHPRCIT